MPDEVRFRRAVFVIHTQSQPEQARLYESLAAWGERVGIGIVQYDDWSWETDHAYPDTFGRLPPDSDIWAYMPFPDEDALKGWFRTCEVVLVVESGRDLEHTTGVRTEIHELGHLDLEKPPAKTLVVSLENERSELLKEKVGGLVREFLQIDSPEDARVRYLVALAWLVSRLERSGPAGMEILTAAQRSCPYLNRFVWFGPFWTAQMLEANSRYSPISGWWQNVADLNSFMVAEATGVYLKAWSALTDELNARWPVADG